MDIQNKRIPDDVFQSLREEVLTQWPTGKGVDLQEAVDYHKAMPEERIFAKKLLAARNDYLASAKREGDLIIQQAEEIKHLKELLEEQLEKQIERL